MEVLSRMKIINEIFLFLKKKLKSSSI